MARARRTKSAPPAASDTLLPMNRPTCPSTAEHGRMHLRNPLRQSKEQLWCGTWYDCQRCTSSTLFPSPSLTLSLTLHKEPHGQSETQ
jgi:hypothetical protein